MLEEALKYWNKGKSVIPVGNDKKPLVHWQEFQTHQPTYPQMLLWWKDLFPGANIAMPTGEFNGVVVIDCDSDEANESFLERYPGAKDTLTAKTPRGYHYYFKREEEIRNDASRKLGKGIDIRGDGGYVLVPPSVLDGDRCYRWLNHQPAMAMGESLRSAIRSPERPDRVDGQDGQIPSVGGGRRFGPGERNQQLTKVAGSFRRYGLEGEALVAALSKVNSEQCDPPLNEKEIRTIARSVQRYEPEDVPDDGNTLIEVSIDSVKTEEVHWLWHHRIPLGRITLIEGDPGVCKSWLTLAVASAVTTGEDLPGQAEGSSNAAVRHEEGDSPRSTGKVILFSAEDTLSDTVRPRLEGQGADLSKVVAVQGVLDANGERGISLRDIGYIERVIRKHKASMVVIDPVVAYVGGIDANRAQDVRSVLAPLTKVAERNQCAIVLVRHLNKSTDLAGKYRGQGSIDWLGACRSAFQVIQDPNNRHLRYVVHFKNSLEALTPTLVFSVENKTIEFVGENWMTLDEVHALKRDKKKNEDNQDTDSRGAQDSRADVFG